MSVRPPTVEPREPGEPSNRWPWLALALGVLIVVIAVAFFLFNQQRTVNVTVQGTSTANPVARAVSTVPPTPLAPTATPLPSPTPVPATPTAAATPTPVPQPTQVPTQPAATAPPVAATTPPDAAPTSQPAAAAATTAPNAAPAAATSPPAPAATQPASAPTQAPAAPATPAPTAPAAPSPTPFAGQVANAGGLGNTRADLDSAYGPPAGETPEHLVVYRKNTFEYHAGFVPDPNGRAALIAELPQANAQPWTLEQATAEGHKLLPKDAQPPNAQPEGNDQYVVERYTSQLLGQVLPEQVFTANKGQPGQFLAVYIKDSAQGGRITRIIVGPGTDPQALLSQGR
jgi:hypothetical protein